ncbi:MAG TPA: heavy metal-associated domain-containing protein [Candidatus Acidoferrales bacterium]|jgi:copper chaperone CopZ|nr:heavy metal-associated domain-containing protein [Candidatus Acidoferrales bacterium]
MHRFAVKDRWPILLLLTIGVFVAASAFWPARGSSPVAAADNAASSKAGTTKTIHMRIAGMTCASCARGLEASFRRMAGVEKASIDYKNGQATIIFDPARQSADSLSKFVADCGYQVKELKAA